MGLLAYDVVVVARFDVVAVEQLERKPLQLPIELDAIAVEQPQQVDHDLAVVMLDAIAAGLWLIASSTALAVIDLADLEELDFDLDPVAAETGLLAVQLHVFLLR